MQKVKFSFSAVIAGAVLLMFMASCSSNEMAFHKRKYQPWFAAHHLKAVQKEVSKTVEEPIAEVVQNQTLTNSMSTVSLEKTAVSNTQETAEESFVTVQNEVSPQTKLAPRMIRLAKAEKIVRQAEAVFTSNESLAETSENESDDDDIEMILYIILAIIFPPLAVFLIHGLEMEFWLSIILTILGYVPGQVYAIYLVLKKYGKV